MTPTDEQFRHRCEVRHLIAKSRRHGLDWLKGFVKNWKRWPDSALRTDFWLQWNAGNRGKYGEWVEIAGAVPDPEPAPAEDCLNGR